MVRTPGNLTRDEVLETLGTTEGMGAVDFQHGRGVSFGVAGDKLTFTANDKEYELADEAFIKAARSVGIPESYTTKTPAPLIADHLNHWFRERLTSGGRLLLKGNVGLTFVKPQLDVISNVRLLGACEAALGGGEFRYDRCHNDQDLTQFSIISHAKQAEPRRGHARMDDPIYGGVQVQNSLTGTVPIEIAAYIYRQVCTNGAVSVQNMFKWSRRNVNEDIFEWVAAVTQQAFTALDHEFAHVNALIDIPVEGNLGEVVQSLFEEYRIPVATRQEIMERILKNPENKTLYDIWNAVTWVASNAESMTGNPRASKRLMQVAGDMLVNPHLCPTCHHMLKT